MNTVKEILRSNLTPLQTVITEANHIQAKCRDYEILNTAKDIHMNPDGRIHFAGICDGNKLETDIPLTRWSAYQLSTRLGIPFSYLETCLDKKLPLAAENVNSWLAEREASCVLRTYDNGFEKSIRGIVSSRYTKYDSPQILENIQDVLDESQWGVRGYCLNPERLHIRVVQNDPMGIALDQLFPALFIDSSDVGRCALHVRFGIFRLACTNGLVIPLAAMNYHHRHIGIQEGQLASALKELVAELPEMVENSEAFIRAARAKEGGLKMLTQKETEHLLRELKAVKIGDQDAQKVMELAQTTYDFSKWGIINAITEYAQTKSLDQRLEYEKVAGSLLFSRVSSLIAA